MAERLRRGRSERNEELKLVQKDLSEVRKELKETLKSMRPLRFKGVLDTDA